MLTSFFRRRMFGLQDNLAHVRGPVPGLKVKFGPCWGPCTWSQVKIWLTSGSSPTVFNDFSPEKNYGKLKFMWEVRVFPCPCGEYFNLSTRSFLQTSENCPGQGSYFLYSKVTLKKVAKVSVFQFRVIPTSYMRGIFSGSQIKPRDVRGNTNLCKRPFNRYPCWTFRFVFGLWSL